MKAILENSVRAVLSFELTIYEENVSGEGYHSWALMTTFVARGWVEHLLPDSSPDGKRALQQLFKLCDDEGYYHLEDLVRTQS